MKEYTNNPAVHDYLPSPYPLEQLVTDGNINRWKSTYGSSASEWLDTLPAMVASYAETWGLEITEPMEGGTASVVISAEQRDNPAVLKIHPPWLPSIPEVNTSAEIEAAAFKIWDGDGAPQLLAHDDQALLLERVTDAEQLVDIDADGVADLLGKISRRISHDALELGIPDISSELFQRFQRAAAKPHPEFSTDLLVAAWSLTATIARMPVHSANFPHDLVLIHGDLKPKNILQRPDGTHAVIDPCPALGSRLFDATLWTINKPDNISERCDAIADYIEISPRIVGNLALGLMIPEICLASSARAEATLVYAKEFAGTSDLESYFSNLETFCDWHHEMNC